jgi:hypothetical protein
MSIVIKFIAITNYEIQTWILKTCCMIYIHKIKNKKIFKVQKIKKLKMIKPKQQTKP